MILRLLMLVFVLFSYNAQCQTIQLRGKILGDDEKPLEFVNVAAFSQDSALISGTITDEAGVFQLNATSKPAYIKLTFIGFKDSILPLVNLTEKSMDLGEVKMVSDAIGLKEVEVTAQRALVERQIDRLVVNVAQSISNAGTNAIEVLGRSPGVFVDANGVITLRGKTGVNVMINGKRMRLSAEDLSSFLRGIPSSQIEKIELIHNPSAAFDADGNAGIINIVLKKDQSQGTNGSLNASYGQGLYARSSAGLSLNHRNKFSNITAGLSHNLDQRYTHLYTVRRYTEGQNLVAILDQDAESVTPTNNYLLNLGADIDLTKSWVLGFNTMGNLSFAKQRGDGHADILDALNTTVGGFDTESQSTENRANYTINLNTRKTLNKGKTDFSLDADYGKYNMSAKQLFNTFFLTNTGALDTTLVLKGDIDGGLELYAIQGDFNTSTKSMGRFSAGFKTSYVQNDNDLLYTNDVGGVDVPNSNFSNRFQYKENIRALYSSWSNSKDKWTYQAGLRLEQTLIEGKQLVTNESFSRNFIQVFPSVFLQYKHSQDFTYGFNAGRRINRPNYNQLNPFKSFVDASTVRSGNPNLIPENTWNVAATFNYKSKLDINLQYSKTLNNLVPAYIQNDTIRLTTVMMVNIGKYNYMGADISYSFNPIEKMNSRLNLEVFYNEFLGTISGNSLNAKGASFRARLDNSMSFGKGWTAELNGYYQPSYTYGISRLKPFWRLDVGIQKSLFKGAGRLRLSGSDLFWRGYPRGATKFANIDETFRSVRDSRFGMLSFTYNFGNKNVKANRRRNNGAQEEKRRTS